MSSYTEASPLDLSTLFRSLQAAIEVGLRTESRDEILRVDAVAFNILLALRGRANSLVAVNKLPPEILLDVFERATCTESGLNRQSGSISVRSYYNQGSIRALIQLTLVCKRWRDVALSTSTLWARTRIDDVRRQLTDVLLIRSGSSPISLRLYEMDTDRSAKILQEHAHHIARLDLALTDGCPCPLFSSEAPLLECLTIVAPYISHPSNEGAKPMLFQTYKSGIQALALYLTHRWWLPEHGFYRLTHLYLSTVFADPGSLRWSKLHLLLSNTPSLQHFHLTDVVGELAATETLDPIASVIPLPSLRSLTCFECTMSAVLVLLTSLEFPRDVLVRFDSVFCSRRTPPPRRIPSEAWLSSLTQLYSPFEESTYLSIIAEGPNSGLCMRVLTDATWVGYDWGFWRSWLESFCALIPLPSIASFVVSPFKSPMVTALCHQLPSLTELEVIVYCHPNYDDITRHRAMTDGLYHALADGLYCPNLKVLRLSLPMGGDPWIFAPPQLIETAAARAAMGRPFHRLAITVTPSLSHPLELFETAFGPVAEYVSGETEIRAGVEESSFSMKEMWEVPDAEKWWDLPEEQRASYVFNSQA